MVLFFVWFEWKDGMSERKSFFKTAKKQLSRQQEKIRQKVWAAPFASCVQTLWRHTLTHIPQPTRTKLVQLVKGEHVEDEEYDEHVANFHAQAVCWPWDSARSIDSTPPFCFPCCSLQLTVTTTLFPVMFMLKMHASRLQKEVGNYIKAVRGW